MTDKSTILRAFNTHLVEFLDDIISIIPDNINLVTTKNSFEMYKKANPTLLCKIWYSCIYLPYAEIIEKGDIDFFINKDYSEDLCSLQNSKNILGVIDTLRIQIKEMSETNQSHSLEYIRNLCKLSNMYTVA
jgi:hypothetical protein